MQSRVSRGLKINDSLVFVVEQDELGEPARCITQKQRAACAATRSLPRVVQVHVLKSCHCMLGSMLGPVRLAAYREFGIAPVVHARIHVPVVELRLMVGFFRLEAFPVFRDMVKALLELVDDIQGDRN